MVAFLPWSYCPVRLWYVASLAFFRSDVVLEVWCVCVQHYRSLVNTGSESRILRNSFYTDCITETICQHVISSDMPNHRQQEEVSADARWLLRTWWTCCILCFSLWHVQMQIRQWKFQQPISKCWLLPHSFSVSSLSALAEHNKHSCHSHKPGYKLYSIFSNYSTRQCLLTSFEVYSRQHDMHSEMVCLFTGKVSIPSS